MKTLVFLFIFTVLIFTFSIQDVHAELIYHSTIGETGVPGSDNNHFNDPFGIAVDSLGNVYVGDPNNNRVQKFDSAGVYQLTLGETGIPGNDNNHFARPSDVTVDSLGNVYVADYQNGRVQKFDSAGVYQSTIGDAGNPIQYFSPISLAVDSSDNLYAGDLSGVVYKFDSAGIYQSTIGVAGGYGGAYCFWSPDGVAVDSLGNVYVADGSFSQVVILDSAGVCQSSIGEWGVPGDDNFHFGFPTDVAVDSLGNIYVADGNLSRIQIFDSAEVYLSTLGEAGVIGSDNNHFKYSNSVAVDLADNVYVVDQSNHRIQIFTKVIDSDNDGVLDNVDNCPNISNPLQEDTDNDGIGDVCDTILNHDTDNDGIDNLTDNCLTISNKRQIDRDSDGIGDACDSDIDNDTILNNKDNCALVSNLDQKNTDGDSKGNACDLDDDNDGVVDRIDNCQFIANTDQANTDGDKRGDVCEAYPFAILDVSPNTGGKACNIENAIFRDGIVAGLDYQILGSLSGEPDYLVANCIAADFGHVQNLGNVTITAGRDFNACNSGCSEPYCTRENESFMVFKSSDLQTYSFVNYSPYLPPTETLNDYLFTVAEPARYVAVCRSSSGPAASDIMIDSISRESEFTTLPSLIFNSPDISYFHLRSNQIYINNTALTNATISLK